MKPNRTDGDEKMARDLANLGMDSALRYAATIEDPAAIQAAMAAERRLSGRSAVLLALSRQLTRVRRARA
jgi:hypothetical protein